MDAIHEWKNFWMNQRQNSEADYQNYRNRAFGVDANMKHHLAGLIAERLVAEVMKPELKDVISYQAGYEDGRKSILESEEVKGLVEACLKENPKAFDCDHDYEPNTTMDYFRCEKCDIRPNMAEALAKLQDLKKKVICDDRK